MFDLENPKTRRKLIFGIVAVAMLMVVIIFYDKFDSFFSRIGNLLSVLSSLFVGVVIAYLLNPIERFFSKVALKRMKAGKMHKFLSIFLTYFVVIGFITIFLLITIPQLFKSIAELPAKLNVFIESMKVTVNGWLVNIEASEFYQSISESLGNGGHDLRDLFNSLVNTFLDLETLLADLAGKSVSIVANIYSATANLLIGFILSIYLLSAKGRLGAQGKMLTTSILGQVKAKRFFRLLKFSDRTFGSFLQGKVINSTITGIISGIVFSIFGLPYPQLLAVIVGVTDIIPVFGPFIGGIPCAFLVLISAPEKLILFIILILVIQQVDGNYIAPKILGESTGLSALGVFIAIIIMGGYFNLVGMIIGVPLFAIIYSIIKTAVEKELASQGLSTDIIDYYYKLSDDRMEEEHNSYFKRIVDFFISSIKKLVSFVVALFTGKNKSKDTGKAGSKKARTNAEAQHTDDNSENDDIVK